MAKKEDPELTARYADMLSAMGTEPRLRILRLLLSAHPEGMVVGEVGEELGIPSSTLSHHLEKLKNEDLVRVRPEAVRNAELGALTGPCKAAHGLSSFKRPRRLGPSPVCAAAWPSLLI